MIKIQYKSKMLKFASLAVAIIIAFPLAAKAQDKIIPGQKQFTGALGKIEDFGLKATNRDVVVLNESMQDLDKKGANGDLTATDGIAVQKQSIDARRTMQNTINDTLQKIQAKHDAASQYIASHPGDMKAVDAAQQLAKAYNQVAELNNQNGQKIYEGNQFLEKNNFKDLPPPPNNVDKIPIPAAMPSQLEVQKTSNGNKPPGTTEPPKPGNESNGNIDAQNVSSKDPLQRDIDASYNTRDNLDALIQLALLNRVAAANNAASHPGGEGSLDDLAAQADAQAAANDLQKLIDWHDRIQNRIWSDLDQKYPPTPDDKKSAGDAQNPPKPEDKKSANDEPGYPMTGDPIADLLNAAGGTIVVSSDQSDESTQKFIDSVTAGNEPGVTVGQSQDTARDHARDSARDSADSARDAATTTARDNARGSIDHCPPRGGCH